MPLVYADGSMGDFLFVVLQEPKGQFPKTKQIFNAQNLVVTAGTSHIMTKEHMKQWVSKVSDFILFVDIFELSIFVLMIIVQCIFTPSTPSNELVILLDSRTSFRDKAAIDSSLPPGMTLHTRQIPAGTTGICQPLDVFFFRPFKGLVRRIQTHAFKNYPTFIAFKRDNILKLISIAFRIIRSPQFKPMIQYAWHSAGYLDSPPSSRFKTPVEYCFPRTIHSKNCHIILCPSKSFILCPLCDYSFCFECYIVKFHVC